MALHQTKVRPRNEPYEIHRARQKAQQEDLKVYLRGRPVWISCALVDTRKGILTRPPLQRELKKVKIQGTYRVPLCPMCNLKDKPATKRSTDRCRCGEVLR